MSPIFLLPRRLCLSAVSAMCLLPGLLLAQPEGTPMPEVFRFFGQHRKQ